MPLTPFRSRSQRAPIAWLALALLVALPATPVLAETARLPLSREQITLSFAPVVTKVAPAVVNVYARRLVRQPGLSLFADDPFFRRFFGGPGFGVPRERVQSSLGSGVIVSADGIVVTNNHVIAGADDIKIALADRREFEAEVILKDERTDLAVLRAKNPDEPFPYLELGDSDALEVGDLVLAIGNPFGVGQTVTSGIISALARTRVGVSDYQFFIQTDAAINPGNSGGALVTMDGRLAGINSAIYSRSGGSLGIGFAIPANMVRVIVDSAQAGGAVRRPWFGASMEPVTADIAEALGMRRPAGALIAEVYAGSPAAEAGVRPGDVIVSVEGHEIADPDGFGFRFATQRASDAVEVGVLRRGRRITVAVPLRLPPEEPPREQVTLGGSMPLSGATIVNVSPAVADELRLSFGQTGVAVVETEGGSPAERIGLKRGDVIRAVNDVEIVSTRQLRALTDGRSYRWKLVVQRGDQLLTQVFGG